jgi:hypothetical protein
LDIERYVKSSTTSPANGCWFRQSLTRCVTTVKESEEKRQHGLLPSQVPDHLLSQVIPYCIGISDRAAKQVLYIL